MDNIIKDNTDLAGIKNRVNDVNTGPTGTDHQHTTTFVDTESTTINSFSTATYASVVPHVDQAMRDFMAKPLLVSSGSWTTSDVVNTTLLDVSVSATLGSTTFWANKFEGFNLLRGTAVLRVQINANPFQQGKLLLAFKPCLSYVTANIDAAWDTNHTVNISSKRMLPCVELDCRDTGCILEMPYLSPTDWYERTGTPIDWGTFTLCVLSPLKVGSGGTVNVEYSVYMYFNDFELGAPIVPQAGNPSSRRRKYKAKVIQASSSSQIEVDSVRSGKPISTALSAVSSAASSLSSIPIIAPYAGPVAWVTRALSVLASSLGWSKPPLVIAPSVVLRQFDRYAACSEGVDPSMPLTMYIDPKVEVSNRISIIDEDEMSFQFLKKVSTLITSFNWTSAAATNTSLYTLNATPRNMKSANLTKTIGAHTATYAVGPPVFFMSYMFDAWRGSFDIIVKLVKTEFHSGRLQVTWTPTNAISTGPTNNTSMLALRTIIDIREGNEFRINLPFLIGHNYLGGGEYSGQLDIRVLNLLRAPETCAQNIDCLVYVCGGDDFEYAIPKFIGSGVGMSFSPQAGDRGSCIDCIIDEGVGGGKIDSLSITPAYESIGESFTHIRQHLKKFCLTFVTSTSDTAVALNPNTYGIVNMTAVSGVTKAGFFIGDPYSLFASMYLFFKGGVNVKIKPTKANDNTVVANVFPTGANVQIETAAAYDSQALDPLAGIYPGLNGYGIHDPTSSQDAFSVPYQSRFNMSFTRPVYTQNTFTFNTTDPSLRLHLACSAGTFNTVTYNRSVREDFRFGYFTGCLPVLISFT